ncbi:DUF99 family protein [Candidatus Micrarchaeota archaeon]|nr:DUF99 family protein [Candidatus Micrarchaeota archaeon]
MRQVRAVGFDDAAFSKKDDRCLVVGVVCRPDGYVEGSMSCSVKVDGTDALGKVTRAVNSSRFRRQLRVIFIQGFTVAGFNTIDMLALSKGTGLPVVSVLRRKPNKIKVEAALRNFSDFRERMGVFEKNRHYVRAGGVFLNFAGINAAGARTLARQFTVRGNVPEPLRLAHVLASGVSLGESSKNK